ncbi:MAG TPA: histidine phosphatase family protein [Polyangiales bacterium]|jgi:probable phosphoglycerate mutase|nr:histidine phosphatase family protein [Polyangiales bacterium]
MTIFLVRHGETDGNAQRILQRPDVPLNPRGVDQAARLAARMAGFGAAHVLCSDLTRARMTAEPIVTRTGLPIELSPLLAERNFGDLRGLPYADLPGDPFAPDFAPPNGETWDEFHARCDAAFALILSVKQRVTGPLIVVTHGLVCRALAQRKLRLAAGQGVPDRFGNTSLTIVDSGAPYGVQLLNCTAHLQAPAADGGAA